MEKKDIIKSFSCPELYLLYYLIKGKQRKYYSFNTEDSERNHNFFWTLYGMHKDEVISFNKVKLKLDGYYEDSAVKNIAEFLKNGSKEKAKKILCDSSQKAFFKMMEKGYNVEEFIDLMEHNNKFAIIGDHITYDIWDNIVFKFGVSEKQWQILDNFYGFYLDKFTKDEIIFEKKPTEKPRIRYNKQREILLNIIKILLDRFSPKSFNLLGLYREINHKDINIYRDVDIFEHLLILERDKIIKINEISINGKMSLVEANIDIDEIKFNILTKDIKPIADLKLTEKDEDLDDIFGKKIDILEKEKDERTTARQKNIIQNPKFIIKGNIGYLKIGKKEVKICDIRNSKRKSGLLESLTGEFYRKNRTIDVVFNSMRLPKDDKDSLLQDDRCLLNRKKDIIRTNWKEVQKILREKKLNKTIYLHIKDFTVMLDWI